jgi:hypothetical protein
LGNPSNGVSTDQGTSVVQITTTGSEQSLTIDARFFQLSGKYVF